MKENHHTHTHTLTIHTHNTDTHIKENHQRDGLRFCLKWLKRIDEGNKVCVLLSCVLLCSAQPTHLNIVACDPRHAHSVVPGPLNGLNSVVPGPCMSGHTVLAQRERERSRERESERERERGSTRNSWLLRATGREASRESVSGSVKSQCLASRVSVCHDASRESVSGMMHVSVSVCQRPTRICLHWEPALGVYYLAFAGSLRGLACARHMACMYYEHYCC